MQFFDTHCHIHFPDYPIDADEVLKNAADAGVGYMLAVGCTVEDSIAGAAFAERYKHVWASAGMHPHEASMLVRDEHRLQQFRSIMQHPRVVAIGETGLDYYYQHSSKRDQAELLRYQLDLATEFDKPLVFHIRDAFDDFWKIFDSYAGLKGVVHSFSATRAELDEALARGLYIGLNGIMTFTKDESQRAAAIAVPLERLVIETDAPFLTPVPYRGTICEPKHARTTATFLSKLRGEPIEELARATTENARLLLRLG